MDIVKTATDWARAEMLSAAVFFLFGLAFLLASLGFWQLGKTDLAGRFVIPMGVAGVLLLILGAGLYYSAQAQMAGISTLYAADPAAFLAAEIARADKGTNVYRIAVSMVFPAIIAACALLIPFLEAPVWRAGLMTSIAMFTVLLLIDANANARLTEYRAQLALAP